MKIVFLAVLTLSLAHGADLRFECPEENVIYGYFAFDYYLVVPDVALWEDCGRICNSTTPCKFWSWGKEESDNHNCLLFEADIELDYNNNWISGEKGYPQAQECKEDI